MSKKVANNIFSLLVAKIISAAIVFVGYAAIYRYLGKFGFGQFQYVISYIMLFSVVVDFGIQQMVIKRVSEQKEESKRYLGNFFAVEFFVALAVFGILAVVALFIEHDPIVRNAILVAGFGMFLNALSNPFMAIISAHEDMHIIAVVNFLDSLINVGVMFAAIIFHQYIVFLAIVQALMGIMHMIVYSRAIKRYVPNPQLFSFFLRFDFSLAKSMLRAALPFGLLIGFSIIYGKIDVIILSRLRGYSETGLYTLAYKYFDFLAFVPAIVSSSLYPFFSAKIKEGRLDEVKNAVQTYTRYMIAVAVPLAFGGAILAPSLVTILGGEEGLMAYLALQVLVFASAALFIYSAVNSLVVNQLTTLAIKVSLANIFINTIGNLILIPKYGFQAAAFMTVFSETVQAVCYFYFAKKRIVDFHVSSFFVKPIFAAFLMALILIPFRHSNLLISLPIGMLSYTMAILGLKFFNEEDLQGVKRLMLRRAPVAPEGERL